MSPRLAQLEADVARHLDGLYAFALQLARDPQVAERLVADTTLRARDWWEHFRLGTDLRVWLFTLLYRRYRKERRKSAPAVSDGDLQAAMPGIADLDPEGHAYEAIADDEIVITLDTLPDEYRVPLLLADFHDFGYAEMAEVLGLPERTLKARLFRARQIFQHKLIGYAVAMGRLRLPERARR